MEQIRTKTKGGHEAYVTGMDAASDANSYYGFMYISPTAQNPHGTRDISWQCGGQARNNHPDFNLNMDLPEIKEVQKTWLAQQDRRR